MNSHVRFQLVPHSSNLMTRVDNDDVIFWQHLLIYPKPVTHARVVSFPTLYFNAFHPDLVQVNGPDGYVETPLANCHSSLALYGWRRNLGVARTLRLFSEAVFAKLGFFDFCKTAKCALLQAAQQTDIQLDSELDKWVRAGCFMHSVNHPKLHVLADIARAVARYAQLEVLAGSPENFLDDPLRAGPIWPVYPEIAARLGVTGSYLFKPPQNSGEIRLLDLETFIVESFARYAVVERDALVCARLEEPRYHDLEDLVRIRPPATKIETPLGTEIDQISPYAGLPEFQFWRPSVANISAQDIDPYVGSPLPIDRETRIATAGSCFARNVSAMLTSSGYKHFVTEAAPAGMTSDEARRRQYGVFSARFGNVFTARQLRQLFDRAYLTFEPQDIAWPRPDGRYADPFRPTIEPAGFATVHELLESRDTHFIAVRNMFEQLEVLILTLGLTEGWRARADGAVFPLAPGMSGGKPDSSTYEFHNFTVSEVVEDLQTFLQRLAEVNPAANIILTVSPLPLVATYERRHVLVSSTVSKSILCAAVDEIARANSHVSYFPAYEIVNGAFSRGSYYESDLRSPTSAALGHVMRIFVAHCRDGHNPRTERSGFLLEEIQRNMQVLCDEELMSSTIR
jgi:hypothetical protein